MQKKILQFWSFMDGISPLNVLEFFESQPCFWRKAWRKDWHPFRLEAWCVENPWTRNQWSRRLYKLRSILFFLERVKRHCSMLFPISWISTLMKFPVHSLDCSWIHTSCSGLVCNCSSCTFGLVYVMLTWFDFTRSWQHSFIAMTLGLKSCSWHHISSLFHIFLHLCICFFHFFPNFESRRCMKNALRLILIVVVKYRVMLLKFLCGCLLGVKTSKLGVDVHFKVILC